MAEFPLQLPENERREHAARIAERITKNNIHYVRLAFPDLMGVLRGRVVRADRIPPAIVDGLSIGSRLLITDLAGEVHPSVLLDEKYTYANCLLVPDPDTFVELPWAHGSAVVLSDPYFPDGEPGIASRLALKRAVKYASQSGLSLNIGMEIESSFFTVDGSGDVTDPKHIFSTLGQGLFGQTVLPICDALNEMGLGVDGVVNELAPGEIEFNLEPSPAIEAADKYVLAKLVIREMVKAAGYDVTFMAMPDSTHHGMVSGLHVHHSATDESGSNPFFDPADENGISDVLRHYIGGQLAHARQMAALSTPTMTGYRRYRPGTWAPTIPTWSLDNRTTMLRVMPDRGAATRVENRLPDSAANSHLALAAMIFAGIDGIRLKTDPGRPSTGDATGHTVALPAGLNEACACLSEKSALTDHMGADLVMSYRGVLLNAADRFAEHVTDWEIAEYRSIM